MRNDGNKNSGKRTGKSKDKKPGFQKPYVKKTEGAGKFKPKPKKTVPQKANTDEIRLNKYISNSGLCSRREADLYISTGAVQVNGKVVTELGHKVKLSDEVKFDGRRINPEKSEYVLLNKPKGFSTSAKGENLHKSVYALIANASKARLLPAGRMDNNTTGLLLFTNDGEMLKKLTDSATVVRKIYQVSLDKNLKFEDLEKIQKGVSLEGNKIYVDEVSYIENAPKSEIGIKLHSNKNRVVRKIFENLGYDVLKMDRVAYGGLTKKDLPRGHWKHLSEQELNNLKML
jgi:23S rRNA pseudouridine2605 synthase